MLLFLKMWAFCKAFNHLYVWPSSKRCGYRSSEPYRAKELCCLVAYLLFGLDSRRTLPALAGSCRRFSFVIHFSVEQGVRVVLFGCRCRPASLATPAMCGSLSSAITLAMRGYIALQSSSPIVRHFAIWNLQPDSRISKPYEMSRSSWPVGKKPSCMWC